MKNDVSALPKTMAIGGVARSGTSILMQVCDSHPDIVLSYEFGAFLHIGESWYRHIVGLRKNFLKKALIRIQKRNVLSSSKLASMSFLAQYIIRSMAYWTQPVRAEAVQQMLHACVSRALIIGDKFPGYHLQLRQLSRIENLYPVVIYRDPRDVAQSLIRQREKAWIAAWPDHNPLHTATRVACEWTEGVSQLNEYTDHVYGIRYEEFVTDPVSVMEALGVWLGVDPAGFQTDVVHPTSVGRWKKQLTTQQIDQILSIAGGNMERLRYL